jgi:hypothetical protein
VLALSVIENSRSWLFSTIMGVVWPLIIDHVGSMLRRRRSSRKKRLSAEAVCMRWPKVPFHEASVLQTDLKIE